MATRLCRFPQFSSGSAGSKQQSVARQATLARSAKKTGASRSTAARNSGEARKKSAARNGKAPRSPRTAPRDPLETQTPGVDEYARHFREEDVGPDRRPERERSSARERWQDFKERIEDLLQRIHRKGRERLTIMVIPHTEKKILNLHVSLYTISFSLAALTAVLIISMVSLVGKSGEDIQFYEMGLTNSQFNMQSVKMAEEMMPLHELINEYTNTIAELYIKLDGAEEDVSGQGGEAQAVIDTQAAELRDLVAECQELGDACGQDLTEEILRRVIYLSRQDNHNLKKAVELSEKILAELSTREKQHLLRNTPSIWPARGHLLSPYGRQADPLHGRDHFQRGIGIGALPGTEVLATAPGEVMDLSYDASYGLQIRIRHRYGIKTFYAHLDRVRVKKGDQVEKGQVIGYVGKSGATPVYQLYYEVHVGTVAYNPHAFLNHLQDQWLIQPRT